MCNLDAAIISTLVSSVLPVELARDMQTDTQGEATGSFLPRGGFPPAVGALTACLALQITRSSATPPSSWPWSSPWGRQCPTHTTVSGQAADRWEPGAPGDPPPTADGDRASSRGAHRNPGGWVACGGGEAQILCAPSQSTWARPSPSSC